jgi:hypothetical protein
VIWIGCGSEIFFVTFVATYTLNLEIKLSVTAVALRAILIDVNAKQGEPAFLMNFVYVEYKPRLRRMASCAIAAH